MINLSEPDHSKVETPKEQNNDTKCNDQTNKAFSKSQNNTYNNIYNENRNSKNDHKLNTKRALPIGTRIADKYTVVESIGSGSYGAVYRANQCNGGPCVAIKHLLEPFKTAHLARRTVREIEYLKLLQGHSRVVQLLDVCYYVAESDTAQQFNTGINNNAINLFLVFEYVDCDLAAILCSHQYLTNHHIQYYIAQLLAVVHDLHSSNLIHRDIKPQNILTTANCQLKLADFGMARALNTPSTITPNSSSTETIIPANNTQIRNSTLTSNHSNINDNNNDSIQDSTVPQSPSPPPPTLTRQYSLHVVTRWYRPPEVICMHSEQTPALDMWAVGCVLAELLQMQKENGYDWRARRALFPGKTCFPLSVETPTDCYLQSDQLQVIISVLGTPTEHDISFLPEDSNVKQFLNNVRLKAVIPLVNWQTLYPGSDPLALDLLSNLLRFNPNHRLSATQALMHPYLRHIIDLEMLQPYSFSLHCTYPLECHNLSIAYFKEWLYNRFHCCNSNDNNKLHHKKPSALLLKRKFRCSPCVVPGFGATAYSTANVL
jgi:mitogen-activated protein kinase 1/3